MNVRVRSLLIATVVCSLALTSIPSLTPAINATLSPDDEVSTPQVWCVENSQSSSDWSEAAYAEKSSVWTGFRTLLPLATTISIVKDILLAGNMPAAHLRNKPFLFFVIYGPINKSFNCSDNITYQCNCHHNRSLQ